MKGAGRAPVGAGFLQRHIVLDDAHNVRLALEIFDEGLREAHQLVVRNGDRNLAKRVAEGL